MRLVVTRPDRDDPVIVCFRFLEIPQESPHGRAVEQKVRVIRRECDRFLVSCQRTPLITLTAQHTADRIAAHGSESIQIRGDIGDSRFCERAVQETISRFGTIDVLVNDAGEQHPQDDITKITDEQLERTFRTNIFGFFYMVRSARPHLKPGSAIVNIASVTAYKGQPVLLDYSATKGAIVSFTRSLSISLAKDGVRVNAVAPGPIWTPLIPSTYKAEDVKTFGADTPMKRPGQPYEVAAGALFLASDDASYISGQTLHINGGTVVNG